MHRPDEANANPEDNNVVTHHVAGSDLGGLTIVLDNLIGIAGGSVYEIAFPRNMGWPEPYEPIGTAQDGALSGALTDTILPSEVGAPDVVTDATPVVSIDYQVDKAPTKQGTHVFNAKVSAGPHGKLVALDGHTIHLTADHGTGTIELIDKSGKAFVRAIDAAEVGNLRFRYKPAGYMAPDAALKITLPTDWSPARTDNPGDGSDDPGEIAVSSKARVEVADDNASFTVIATEAWNSGDTIVITYRDVKVADIVDGTTQSDTFDTESKSYGSADFKALAASPIVGIGRDPDGSGSIALSLTETDTATSIGTLMITYTAAGKMEIGSVVEITVPDTGNWPDPTLAANFALADETRAARSSTAATETAAATLAATTSTEFAKDETIIFLYKNIGAQTTGTHTFSATSTVTYDGTPTPLGTGTAEIAVTPVVPGSVTLTYVKDEMVHALNSAAPGVDLGQITFTFEAEAPMESGSQVEISIPAMWYPPFRGNTAADNRRGAVWVAGATVDIDPGPQAAGPWTITATPDGGLAVGATLVFTYNAGEAPGENVYTFTTMASVASDGRLVSIASSPPVIVREPVTALAVVAAPDSVFVNDDITVTVTLWDADGEGRALGAMVIMLSDGDAGGGFTDADGNAITSVTIENLGFSASATYSNAMANPMVTLTATSGELTASDDVEVKSTISNLQVNGLAEPLPIQGVDTITVTADGRAGTDVRATVVVTKSAVDADGNEIVSSVVPTKSLDIVPTAPDAPETDDVSYTRDVALGGLDDGDYMVTVNIGDDQLSAVIEVVNDQTPPTLSNAEASKAVVVNGDHFTLSVDVAMNESMTAIASVMADVSMLDDTQTDGVALTELTASPGTYTTIITVSDGSDGSDANTAEDGEKTITITATDRIGSSGTAMVMVTLENDASELHTAEVTPASGKPGETIWIKATGSEGGSPEATVTNSESGMMIAQVTLEEDADAAGSYSCRSHDC